MKLHKNKLTMTLTFFALGAGCADASVDDTQELGQIEDNTHQFEGGSNEFGPMNDPDAEGHSTENMRPQTLDRVRANLKARRGPSDSPSSLSQAEAQVIFDRGLDPTSAYVTEERVAWGDAFMDRAQLRERANDTVKKGYTTDYFSEVNINSVCLDTSEVDPVFHRFAEVAAARLSNTMAIKFLPDGSGPTLFTPGIQMIARKSNCPSDWLRIRLKTANFAGIAQAGIPESHWTEGLIELNKAWHDKTVADSVSDSWPDAPVAFVELMMHEIGHTIGLAHPQDYANVRVEHVRFSDAIGVETVMDYQLPYYSVPQSDELWTAGQINPTSGCFATYSPADASSEECTDECPCEFGRGDCDSGECKNGLECGDNNGPRYGLPQNWDTCVAPSSCPTFTPGVSPDSSFCNDPDCPCGVGEGDCEPPTSPSEDLSDQLRHAGGCGGFLECASDIGRASGMPNGYDLCRFPVMPGCEVANPNASGACANLPDGCKCRLGEGDCDSSDDCRGDLICGADIGSYFGLNTWVDVCVMPGTPGIVELGG